MAVYKVAQDVEADDKLLGPFTFRQFIYLIIVAMAGFLAYGLSKLLLPLAIIPLPVILFFGALALPLRKDQPMETYLAAMISFYLKPHRRLWKADGLDSLIEITVPKEVEIHRTKNLSGTEAEERFSYLANIADTAGWSVRHVVPGETSMIGDVYNEAQQTQDLLDTSSSVGQSIDTMITQADQKRRSDMLARVQQSIASPEVAPIPTLVAPVVPVTTAPAPVADPYVSMPTPQPVAPAPDPTGVTFNPYPTIHQSVVQPFATDDQVVAAEPEPELPQTEKSTSDTVVSPDIINLANNSDLSIETIAREAHRRQEKDAGEGEVFISLR